MLIPAIFWEWNLPPPPRISNPSQKKVLSHFAESHSTESHFVESIFAESHFAES